MKKTIAMLLVIFLCHHSKAQLPFSPVNFLPHPGTVMQQQIDPNSNDQYLSFQHAVPASNKGFTLNISGTTRTDLNFDLPVYEGSLTSSIMEINLTNTGSFLFTKAAESQQATLQYLQPFSGDPEFPVVITPLNIVIHDEMDIEHPLVIMPGIFGSLQVAGPLSPLAAENDAYLIGMSIIPNVSGSVMQLFFHSKMVFTIGSNIITGSQIDIHLTTPYSMLSSVDFTLNQIEGPASVFSYATDPMPLSMNMPVNTTLQTNDILTITGNNFLYLINVHFNGLPMLYEVVDNFTLNIMMPELPCASQLTLESIYGDIVSPGIFSVSAPQQCDAIPNPNSLFFYLPTPSTVNAVLKWDYSGDPSSVFEVRYKEVSDPSWTTVSTGMLRELTLPVTAELQYEFQVNATCPNMLVSEWSDSKTITIGFSDEIYVSEKLDKALDVWRLDTINQYPMDSFLIAYTDGANTPDANEVDGFIMRFFQTGTLFMGKRPIETCVCRKVFMDYGLIDNQRDNGPSYKDVAHEQYHHGKNFRVGTIIMGYNYKGASTRNYAFCQDFQAWCADHGHKSNGRRHTEKSNNITEQKILGDANTISPSFTQLKISYACANPDKIRTDCGCEKKVYISAMSRVNACISAQSSCSGHTKKESGSMAEAGGGSIIVTGLLGNFNTPISDMRVVAAGFTNLKIEQNHQSNINPDFVKKGIRLLQSVTMAVAAGTAGGFPALVATGTLDKAVDDLVNLIGTKVENVVYDQDGSNGCHEFIVATPLGEYITLFPNEKRYVAIATNSYSAIKASGCHYKAEAYLEASHHIAAVTNRLDFEDNTACCLQPTGIYSTYAIDQNYNIKSGGSSNKEMIGKLFFAHGDMGVSLNPPYMNVPLWLDDKGFVTINNDVVIPYNFVKTDGISGRISGVYKVDCHPDSLHEVVGPTTGNKEAFRKDGTSLLVYPNAIKDQATIEYTLNSATGVTLTVYDMTGKKVLELLNGAQHAAGTYKVNANLGEFMTGQYIVLLSSNNRNSYQYILKE